MSIMKRCGVVFLRVYCELHAWVLMHDEWDAVAKAVRWALPKIPYLTKRGESASRHYVTALLDLGAD